MNFLLFIVLDDWRNYKINIERNHYLKLILKYSHFKFISLIYFFLLEYQNTDYKCDYFIYRKNDTSIIILTIIKIVKISD